MAVLLRANGSKEIVRPAEPPEFTLQELQGYVGGYIEIVRLDDRYFMVLDEQGKLKEKPRNLMATTLAIGAINPGDFIVGDALIVSTAEVS